MRSPPKIFHNRPQSVMENITASLANVANESCLLKSYWQWHHIYHGSNVIMRGVVGWHKMCICLATYLFYSHSAGGMLLALDRWPMAT